MANIIATDFQFRHEGSVVIVTPVTDEAKAFTHDRIDVQSWQWWGGGFAVDARIAADLQPQLEDEGLSVSHA